ncbi:MAG: hypothetical protein Q8Q92_03125 [bacterium]|nr:hypothetical protein [bacterium]
MNMSRAKTYVFAVVLSLVLLNTLAFGSSIGMETDQHGRMSSCPFTMASPICAMSFSEHISLWQSIFTAVVDTNAGVLALVSMVILAIFITSKYLKANKDKKFVAYKFYAHERQQTFTSNKLLELFSRGILNPKIY